jgi:formylglycine-generating enzyme required for sulfatase activity
VNYVFRVGAQQDGEDWLFYVQALSPMMAGAVWQRDELTAASSALRAARDACAYLAADFLYRQEFVTTPPIRGNSSEVGAVADGGSTIPAPSNPPEMNVVTVTPSQDAADVDGQEVGLPPEPADERAPTGFVYIAPGMFVMGSPSSEEGRGTNETQHSVTLTRGFYLQTTEVTQGEFWSFMGTNPSHFVECGSDCFVE